MAEMKNRDAVNSTGKQTVISKKGAVMKVTRISLSARARSALRSNSAGIVTKTDDRSSTDRHQQEEAHA